MTDPRDEQLDPHDDPAERSPLPEFKLPLARARQIRGELTAAASARLDLLRAMRRRGFGLIALGAAVLAITLAGVAGVGPFSA